MKTLLGLTFALALAAAVLALDAAGYLGPATTIDATPDLLMVVASARG